MQKTINILNVRFDNVTLDDAVDYILTNIKKGYVCTPNPEMLLESLKNRQFLNVLNHSKLNIPDGIGILWAATEIANHRSKFRAILDLPLLILFPNKFRKVLKERVTGIDLLSKVCLKASITGEKLFFLGASPGIATKAANILKMKFPDLNIAGTFAGSPSPQDRHEIINLINEKEPDLLFVAYGAPKQELWIAENIDKLKTVKVAIGIGGAFDFIAGIRKRAPKLMQNLGLEWLYRLFQEPSRIKRIYNATVKFPTEVIKRIK